MRGVVIHIEYFLILQRLMGLITIHNKYSCRPDIHIQYIDSGARF